MPALPPLIHDKSRMRRRACTDPCGGRSAMVVPTATVRAEQRVVQEGSSPSGAQMRGAISKKRGSQPRWPEKAEGMERSKRARRRKLDTAKADLKPPHVCTPEGRVSIARWNPKGLRRSTGP